MNGLTVTPEIINQLEARKIISQEFQTLIQQYESFYHARHFSRANAMLSDIQFYCQILGLKIDLVLGRTDLDSFFIDTVSDSVLKRFGSQIKTVSETVSKPFQKLDTVSETVLKRMDDNQTVSKDFQNDALEQIEPQNEEFETVSIFEKSNVNRIQSNEIVSDKTVSVVKLPVLNNPETVSVKHAFVICKCCQKVIQKPRPNKEFCDKICKSQYHNKNRKSA